MSIHPIEREYTHGLLVRVFRDGRVLSRFFAYGKYGGKQKTWHKARREEKLMELQAGPPIPCRRKGFHTDRPSRNSSTGIAGIRAFVVDRPGRRPVLQFCANWRQGPKDRRSTGSLQRSSEEHGILGALGQVLDARAKGSGLPQPSPRKAWEIIKRNMGWNK